MTRGSGAVKRGSDPSLHPDREGRGLVTNPICMRSDHWARVWSTLGRTGNPLPRGNRAKNRPTGQIEGRRPLWTTRKHTKYGRCRSTAVRQRTDRSPFDLNQEHKQI